MHFEAISYGPGRKSKSRLGPVVEGDDNRGNEYGSQFGSAVSSSGNDIDLEKESP